MHRDFVTTVFARFLLMVLGLASSIITARTLGPEGRGQYGVGIAFANLIVQFGSFGMGSTLTYQLAADLRVYSKLLANAIWISIVSGVVIASLAAAAAQLLNVWPNTPVIYLWASALLVLPVTFCSLGGNLLVATERIRLFNILQVLSGLLLLAVLIVAWKSHGSVGAIFAATLIAWFISAATMLVILWKLGGAELRVEWSLVISGLTFAGKTYLICLLGYLLLRLNLFAVERYCTAAEAGYLAVAIQAVDVLLILPTSLGMVLFPRLLQEKQSRKHIMTRSLSAISLVMAVVCTIAFFGLRPAIRLAFGEAYLPCVPVLAWMLPGVFFTSLLTIVSQYLSARGVPRGQVVNWFIGVSVLISSIYFLVPLYAAVGGAIAYSISTAVVFVGSIILALSLRNEDKKAAAPVRCRMAA